MPTRQEDKYGTKNTESHGARSICSLVGECLPSPSRPLPASFTPSPKSKALEFAPTFSLGLSRLGAFSTGRWESGSGFGSDEDALSEQRQGGRARDDP